MMQHLNELARKSTNPCHVVAPLDHFYHQGPSGRHLCLVLEPMGPSAGSMMEELQCNQPRRPDFTASYPLPMVRDFQGRPFWD